MLSEAELITRFEVGYNEDYIEYISVFLNTGISGQWGKQQTSSSKVWTFNPDN